MENNSNKEFLDEELTSETENTTSIEDTDSLNLENTKSTEDTNSIKISEAEAQESEVQENETDTPEDETIVSDKENDILNSNVNAKPIKSKRLIQFPLIIAAGILVAAVLAFGVWKIFFDTSIEGTWLFENTQNTATADQADSNTEGNLYVKFTSKIVNEEEGYKEVSAYQGTMERIAFYLIEEDENGTKSLQSSMGLAGEYQITGNWITGRTLTVTATTVTGEEIKQVFKSASLPKVDLPPVSDKFKVNKDIIGEWNESEYQVTYTFREDGTFTLNQYDSSIVDGTYVVYEDQGKITLTYIAQGEQTLDISYTKDGDSLVIDGLGYTKVESEKQ